MMPHPTLKDLITRARKLGGRAGLLNWVAHALEFDFTKGAVFDFVFSLLDRNAQRDRRFFSLSTLGSKLMTYN
jgi:hypothetical protein